MENFGLQLTVFFLCGLWNTGAAAPENCFNEVYGYSGHITSLNYPEPYPSGRNCTWIISTLSIYQLQLNFSTFDLEYHESCGHDYLTVYDGSSTEDKVIGKFCGSSVPYPLTSSKNVVMINFYSDSTEHGRGFNVTYDSALCGANFVQLKGHFMGPSYPDNYPIYKQCFWSIETSNDLQVSLNLSFIQLSSSSNCSTEFIKIFSLAPTDNGFSEQFLSASSAIPLAFICSKKEVLQQNTAIVDLRSMSNKMFIIYESSSPIQNLHFKVSFSSVPCGRVYKKDEGTIGVSYQENNGRNVDCSWTLEVSEGHQVALHSIHLNIYNSSNCTTDFLEIRDGLNGSSPLLINRICVTEIPNVVFSSSNTMWVRLKLAASTSAKGFVANFSKDINKCESGEHLCEHTCQNTLSGYNCSCNDGYILNDDSHTCSANCFYDYNGCTGLVGRFNSTGRTGRNCVWKISMIPGFRIKLVFDDIEMKYHKECLYASVSVYDGDNKSTALLGRFCGNKIPPPILSTGSNMLVVFRTNSTVHWKKFIFEYFPAGSFHRLNSPNGTIQSSNYPNLYPNEEECVWYISTSLGHRIKLVFEDFEIEDTNNCEADSLAIIDGYGMRSPLLGRFCGNKIPSFKISTRDDMILAFRSDSSVGKKGFNVSYSVVCGGNVSMISEYHRLNSHATFGYEDYSHGINCSWRLYEYRRINFLLRFESFELESGNSTGSCNHDYLEIFEGPDANGRRIGIYCGNSIPNDVVSNGSNLYLHFQTDHSVAKRGFSLLIIEL